MLEINKIYNEDCLEGMKKIDDKSVDFIFTDLPFSTTQNSWDVLIPFEPLWEQYERIIKDDGCIALWAQSPFDKRLACSNEKLYRYEWIIEKTKATGHLNAKKMPMKAHENVLIFYKKLPTYNPQMTEGHTPVHSYTKHTTDGNCYGVTKTGISGGGSTQRYPRDVLQFKWDTQKSSLHQCQKPIEACEYFIKTYTNPGDIVFDPCAGSGSHLLVARENNRKWLGMELTDTYFKIANERMKQN